MVNMRNSSVIEKIKCKKIDKFFTDLPKGQFSNILIIALKKFAKQKHLIIMEI